MTRLPRPSCIAVILLAATGLAGVACRGPAEAPSPSAPDPSRDSVPGVLEIVVDLTEARGGRARVSMTLSGPDLEHPTFKEPSTDGYRFHDVRFTDGEGRRQRYRRVGSLYQLRWFDGSLVKVDYEVEPGGRGRHGEQGVVAPDHALFDGRLFLLPRGTGEITARIRFVTPEGWTVASPFREVDTWYPVDPVSTEPVLHTLEKSCFGVGLFEHASRRLGRMEVRVASYSRWSPSDRSALEDRTFRLLEHFHETLGFDLGAPYSVVWVPRRAGRRVFGGSHTNGTCFDGSVSGLRNWQLLAHRVGHSMNKGLPSGMHIPDRQDHWFQEGWASFVEVTSTRAVGIAGDESYWNELYDRYRRAVERTPAKDIPLLDERTVRGNGAEFIHYTKAPLVVKMLDQLVRARSGRTVDEFMAAMWPKYGWHAEPFPVKQELETFTGASFDDFWALMVEQPGIVIPVWSEYIDESIRANVGRRAAAHVGGQPVSGDYLYHLAWSGDFASFAEVRDFLAAEASRRRELRALGVRLYPDEIAEHLGVLPAGTRYAIAKFEAAYPIDLAPGAGAPSGGAPVEVVLDAEQRDGWIFGELLALEENRVASHRDRQLPGIAVQTGDAGVRHLGPERLGFGSGAAVTVRMAWRSVSDRAEISVISNGMTVRKSIDNPSESLKTWSSFEPADRRGDNHIVVFQVKQDGQVMATRPFWQRGSGRW